MSHKGSCHCGQISFEVEGDFDTATECNCSHCSKKGYLLWFVPREQMTLQAEEDALAAYTFNKHQIQHQFCTRCGCAPFAFGEHEGAALAAINLRCLDGVDLSDVPRKFVDGRSL